jgi:hypothetical protein
VLQYGRELPIKEARGGKNFIFIHSTLLPVIFLINGYDVLEHLVYTEE